MINNGTQSPETFFTATLNDSQEEETCQCEGGFSTPPKAYCNQFCKYLSPDQQLKIIATESTCKNEDSLEGEYAINSEWWRAWCDYVNIEFQQAFTISIPDTKECQSSRKRLTELFVPAERKAVLGSNQNELVSFISSSNNGGRSSCNGTAKEMYTTNLLCHEELYQRPGKINNKPICDKRIDGDIRLCENLQEVHDYVRVNQAAWRYLKSWYGCDHELWV